MSEKLFCKFCQNLKTVVFSGDKLQFECITCRTKTDSTPEDTLRYEETRESNIAIYNKVLDKIAQDPVNPKKRKICPKCKYDICKSIRLGEDMRVINMCIECNYQFVEI